MGALSDYFWQRGGTDIVPLVSGRMQPLPLWW